MIPGCFDRRALPQGLRLADVAGHDGWRLRGYAWPADHSRPRGSLFFQTGRADFIEKYLEPLAHWHESGWSVTGFDWRGQGGSARSGAGHAWSLDAMVDDAAGEIARWFAATPRPHVLIGHSMGGHLLLRLLAERAVRVDAAVLVAPMLGLAHAPIPPALARALAAAACALGLGDRPIVPRGEDAFGRQARLTACDDRFADAQWWKQANPALGIGTPSWRWLRAALASIARLAAPGVLERVDVPVLIVATPRDRLVSTEAIRRAAARLPHGRLTMIDGAHELLREADPARTAAFAAIDAFLDEVAA